MRDFDEAMNKQFKNAIGHLLPAKMIPVLIDLSGIDPEKKVNEISREERTGLVALMKKLPLTVTGLRGWNEAIITKGGVSVKDINPSTMESKHTYKATCRISNHYAYKNLKSDIFFIFIFLA